MKTLNIATPTLFCICFVLAACSDPSSVVSEKEDTTLETDLAVVTKADVDQRNFTIPFPPVPGVDFASVPAPCLELGEPLQMSGIWSGWIQEVINPSGRVHVTERIDYSEITLRLGDKIWHAGPGASETIIQNLPLESVNVGDAAFNVIHEFHARFISQSDAPDLRVNHRVRQLLTPDGELKKN